MTRTAKGGSVCCRAAPPRRCRRAAVHLYGRWGSEADVEALAACRCGLQALTMLIEDKRLLDVIGQLTSLTVLNLGGSSKLIALPDSLGELTALVRLHLSSCRRLARLPEMLGQLTALTLLDLAHCQKPSCPSRWASWRSWWCWTPARAGRSRVCPTQWASWRRCRFSTCATTT